MTFDQWLDAPLHGGIGTTRRAYYSDNQLTAARDAWEAATAQHVALLRDCSDFFGSDEVKISPIDANAKAAYLWGRIDKELDALRSRSEQ